MKELKQCHDAHIENAIRKHLVYRKRSKSI
jgi:hypothetical protein